MNNLNLKKLGQEVIAEFRDRYSLIVSLLVALALICRGLSYWIFSAKFYPSAGIDFLTIFRKWGDTQYYPLIKAMSEFKYGESNVFEYLGQGLISFPFFSVSPYALPFRLIGGYAFPVMDLVFVCFHFLLFKFIFKKLNFTTSISTILGLIIVSNLLNYGFAVNDAIFAHFKGQKFLLFGSIFCALAGITIDFKFKKLILSYLFLVLSVIFVLPNWENANVIFQMRIPRPLVTDVFFFSGILALIILQNAKKYGNLIWPIFGVSLALTLQGNLHSAIILALVGFLYWAKELLKVNIKTSFIYAASAIATFLLGSINFLYARLIEDPAQAANLGVIKISRLAPIFLSSKVEWAQFVVCLCLGQSLLWKSKKINSKNLEIASFFILALLFASFFALPISCVILGKGNLLQQFRDRFQLYSTFALLVALFELFRTNQIHEKFRAYSIRKEFFEIGVLTVCILSSLFAGYRTAKSQTHTRDSYQSLKELGDQYKLDFLQITDFLKGLEPDQFKVLATFDPQLFSWWRLFRNGNVYLSDNFSTSLPSEILEARYVNLCKILSMSQETFNKFSEDFLIQSMWLSFQRLSTLPAILNQNFEEYSPADQQILSTSTPLDSWNLAFKIEDRNKMNAQFAQELPTPKGRLDLIVLLNNSQEINLIPNPKLYILKFENHSFRIYLSSELVRKHHL